jgi:hypothetical protein
MFTGMTNRAASNVRTKVFISHARADAGFADQLAGLLSDSGFPLLREGADLGPNRRELVAAADALVLVLTPDSLASDVCAWELEDARQRNKRVIAVLPAPLNGAADLAEMECIYFYSDPAVPQSGFFDGQKRLQAALRSDVGWMQKQAAMERDLRKAQERERKEEKMRDRDERALAQLLAEAHMQTHAPLPRRRGPRFPVFRATILGTFALAVGAIVFVPGMPGRVRSMLSEASAAMGTLTAAPEPYDPNQVAVEEYAPERELIAGRAGANVRDYPLTSGTLLANVPNGTRLRVTGRLQVQGDWWFRVVMPDQRVGFVRSDVVRWTAPERATQTQTQASANVTAIEPAVQISAGRAGANLRTAPRRGATSLVRLPAGAAMNATGKVRAGGHWWVRVTLDDGRNGYVRDDVITAESRSALDL